MGIGFIDFQGQWEGREQFHRFPGFPLTVTSSACLLRFGFSGGDPRFGFRPVLLELRRAEVVQRRVHPRPVIPEQPRDGFILGLADRLKALAMQPFHLQ